MLIDSHCHLDFDDYKDNLKTIIDSAKQSGVVAFQTISTHINKFDSIYNLTNVDPSIYCSVGTHPCNVVDEFYTSAQIINLCSKPKVIGIGETGLDYYHTQDPHILTLQHKSFDEHIIASQETGLPLIIHMRQSDEDLIKKLQNAFNKKPFKAVLHCFASNEKTAYAALEMGFYISFSGIITFKNAVLVHEVASIIPLNRLLVETDSPYLAPHLLRGKRNEPGFITHTAKVLAKLKNETYENICKITTDNFFALFNKAKLS